MTETKDLIIITASCGKNLELSEKFLENISLKLFNWSRLTPAKAPSGKIKTVLCEILGLLNSINSSIIASSLLGWKNLSIEIFGENVLLGRGLPCAIRRDSEGSRGVKAGQGLSHHERR